MNQDINNKFTIIINLTVIFSFARQITHVVELHGERKEFVSVRWCL